MNKQNISITVTKEIFDFMKELSNLQSISLSAYVRRLVLKDMKDKLNEQDKIL